MYVVNTLDQEHADYICRVTCNDVCEVCVQMYSCSCVDYALHYTVCKHVHLVHITTNRLDTLNEMQLDSLQLKQFLHLNGIGQSTGTDAQNCFQ